MNMDKQMVSNRVVYRNIENPIKAISSFSESNQLVTFKTAKPDIPTAKNKTTESCNFIKCKLK